MKQCDYPPCQTDARLYDGDNGAYCIRHFDPKNRKVPNVKKAAAVKGPVDRGGNLISERKTPRRPKATKE